MTEPDHLSSRPGPFSKRFGVVLWLALGAAPGSALAALFVFATGKRVRGWNRLCAIAADNPDYYARWIARAEPARVARWIASNPAPAPRADPIVAIIADAALGDAAAQTSASIRAALGPATRIISITQEPTDWNALKQALLGTDQARLLPIVAGDLVALGLGAVAERLPPGKAACYWDEDRRHAGQRDDAWAKPDWDPLLFQSHHGLLGASLLDAKAVLGVWDRWIADNPALCPAAKLEQLCFLVASEGALHVPLILTHRTAPAEPPLSRAEPDPAVWPTVSIIIPTKDLPHHLSTCLRGLALLEYLGPIELILIDNGSTDPEALRILAEQAERPGTRVLRMPGPFNFSHLNNAAVRIASGAVLCFLNNDVEPLDGQWLSNLVRHALRPDVGAVGAMLLYPDGSIQHAGVAIGIGGAAGHIQKGTMPDTGTEAHRYIATRRVSAVTAACLVVRKDRFIAAGEFDEDAFPVAFNDVDLCLRLDAIGLRNLFIAEVRLIHHESKSRGQDDSPEKQARFARELQQLQQRWQTQTCQDPWHSPLFSRVSERCLLQI